MWRPYVDIKKLAGEHLGLVVPVSCLLRPTVHCSSKISSQSGIQGPLGGLKGIRSSPQKNEQ